MRILFLGDIVGKSGRAMINAHLKEWKKTYRIDFVIANGENATHGKGLIEHHYQQLLHAGIDCITLGNHYNSKNEIAQFIDGADCLVRPYNLSKEFPGVGTVLFEFEDLRIRVTNLLGQAFMNEEVQNPFDAMNEILEKEETSDVHIVDFHGEATGEKQAFAWAFDGKVTAVIGTHTHVQTHDDRILKQGTGFVCDAGMCGPYYGILGAKRDAMIERAWHHVPVRYEVENEPGSIMNGVVIETDSNGLTKSIKTISLFDEHI